MKIDRIHYLHIVKFWNFPRRFEEHKTIDSQSKTRRLMNLADNRNYQHLKTIDILHHYYRVLQIHQHEGHMSSE